MTDTIERMARAMWEAEKAQGMTWEMKLPSNKARWMARAKAALSALEEPSHEMCVAGAQVIDSITEERGRFDHTKIWAAMISAAKGGEG